MDGGRVLRASWRGGRLALLVALLAVIAGVLPPPVAQAANLVNVTILVAETFPNPCTPGTVIVSGDLHIVIHMTEDRQGGYHVGTTLNSQGLSGQDLLTGVAYRASETSEKSAYARPPFPAIVTQVEDVELLSQGGVDNFVFHYNLHVTVNAAGVPTALVDNLRLACRG